MTSKNILKSGLYIVATPIGNLGDITLRAIDTLKNVDLVACEDTRVSKILFDKYGIKTQRISVHNYNEEGKIDFIKNKLTEGLSIALVSDAGTPLISDPGYKLVNALTKDGFYVTTIPGPSSTISALTLSSLPTNKFMFIGFVPTKTNEKTGFFEEIKQIQSTIIFFESPQRLVSTLETINKVLPEREVVITREITKIYEEVKRGTSEELILYFKSTPPKGEIVGLISPPQEIKSITDEKIEKMLKILLKNLSLKDASEFISSMFDISKKEVYNLGINLKNNKE